MIVDRFGIHVFMCFLSFLDGEDVNEVIISTWEKGSSRHLYRIGHEMRHSESEGS